MSIAAYCSQPKSLKSAQHQPASDAAQQASVRFVSAVERVSDRPSELHRRDNFVAIRTLSVRILPKTCSRRPWMFLMKLGSVTSVSELAASVFLARSWKTWSNIRRRMSPSPGAVVDSFPSTT